MSAAAVTPAASIAANIRSLFCPYQLRWIDDDSPLKLWSKSRRIGATYAEAARVVITRTFGMRDNDYFFSSADESAAAEFIRAIGEWAERMGKPFKLATGEEWDGGKKIKTYQAELPIPGGKKVARVLAMSSSPKRFRSKGGDVCLDEFAFHADPAEMYKAAKPVTTWGGQLSILSTNNGDGSLFYRMLEGARRINAGEGKRSDLPFSVHEVYLDDAINDGLAELVNRVKGTSFTRAEFRETVLEGVPADVADEEYHGIARTHAGAYFPRSLTTAAARRDDAMPTDKLSRFLDDITALSVEATRIDAGVDIGRTNDLFVIWAIAKFGGRYRTCGVLVYQDREFNRMREACQALLRWRGENGLRVRSVAIDSTGLGMQLAEEISAEFPGNAFGETFTRSLKMLIYPTLNNWLQDGSLTLPDSEAVQDDFAKVQAAMTPKKRMTFYAGSDDKGHADMASAAALATYAAETKVTNARAVQLAEGAW